MWRGRRTAPFTPKLSWPRTVKDTAAHEQVHEDRLRRDFRFSSHTCPACPRGWSGRHWALGAPGAHVLSFRRRGWGWPVQPTAGYTSKNYRCSVRKSQFKKYIKIKIRKREVIFCRIWANHVTRFPEERVAWSEPVGDAALPAPACLSPTQARAQQGHTGGLQAPGHRGAAGTPLTRGHTAFG